MISIIIFITDWKSIDSNNIYHYKLRFVVIVIRAIIEWRPKRKPEATRSAAASSGFEALSEGQQIEAEDGRQEEVGEEEPAVPRGRNRRVWPLPFDVYWFINFDDIPTEEGGEIRLIIAGDW